MIYFQDENGKVAKEAAQEHIDTVLDATRCPVMRVGNRASPKESALSFVDTAAWPCETGVKGCRSDQVLLEEVV